MTAMSKAICFSIVLLAFMPAFVQAQPAPVEAMEDSYGSGNTSQQASPAATSAYTQEAIQKRELDREAWRKATKGMDFSGNRKKDREPDDGSMDEENPGGGKKPQRDTFSLSKKQAQFGAGALKVLVILIAAVALFFLIRSLLGLRSPRNRKLKTTDLLGLSLEQIEERFQELELEQYIQQAIARGDYALAIRLYYLAALKELSACERIHWKKDKTNRDYLREMRGTPLLPDFQEVTYIFEWVWYGQRQINREDFERLEPKMKRFVENSRAQPEYAATKP